MELEKEGKEKGKMSVAERWRGANLGGEEAGERTYVNERAFLVSLLDREESVKNEELDNGENPGILLGDGTVLDESEHLIESPSPSSFDSLEVKPETKQNKSERSEAKTRQSTKLTHSEEEKLDGGESGCTHSSEAPREL